MFIFLWGLGPSTKTRALKIKKQERQNIADKKAVTPKQKRIYKWIKEQ